MCHGQMVGRSLARTSARARECSECGMTITPGGKYTTTTCKQRGQFYTLMVCFACSTPSTRERWLTRLRNLLR